MFHLYLSKVNSEPARIWTLTSSWRGNRWATCQWKNVNRPGSRFVRQPRGTFSFIGKSLTDSPFKMKWGSKFWLAQNWLSSDLGETRFSGIYASQGSPVYSFLEMHLVKGLGLILMSQVSITHRQSTKKYSSEDHWIGTAQQRSPLS